MTSDFLSLRIEGIQTSTPSFLYHSFYHSSCVCTHTFCLPLSQWINISTPVKASLPFFSSDYFFLCCIIHFPFLTGSATAAAVFRSNWESCLDSWFSLPQLFFSINPLDSGTCSCIILKPICQGHQWLSKSMVNYQSSLASEMFLT